MSSIFTKIINGDIPCYKIAENDYFIAFLDIFPVREGHVLVVPKTEVDYIFDLPDEILARWLIFSKPIAHAIEKSFSCRRVAISVIGLDVPHAHMHLVPVNSSADLNFAREKIKLSDDRLLEIQQKILENLVSSF